MTPFEYRVLEFIKRRTDREDASFEHPTIVAIGAWFKNPDARHAVWALEAEKLIEPLRHRRPRAPKKYLITEAGRNILRQAA
jgi:hypothetical protein